MTERATKPAEEPAGAARTTKVAGEEGSRVPAGPRPAPSGLAPGQVLAFQRSVGNAAVAGSLTRSHPPSRPAPARVGKPAGNAAQAFLQRQAPSQGGSGGSGGSGLAEGAASEAGAGPAVLEERAGPDAEVPSARLQREAAPAQPPGAAGGGVGGAGQGAEGGSWWQQLREFGDLAARLGGKASEVWDKLGPFTDTLWAGVKGGFSGFVTHFSEHFQTQFQGWFANTMGAAGFQTPETWDLHGFFTMVFSVLGINLDSVQSRFAEIDQEGIDGVPELKALHEKGPIALVDLAEGELNTIQEEVVEDVKSNLVTSLVTQGVEFLIGMLAPAAGGVMALVRILRYFWDNRQAFKDLGNRLVSSVDSILGGKVDAVAQVVEGSLAATIPLVLSLFEHLLKLDKLAEKVAGIIGKVRGSITGLIDKVVGRAKEAGRRLMGGRRGAGKGAAAPVHPGETTHASEAARPAAGAANEPATAHAKDETKDDAKSLAVKRKAAAQLAAVDREPFKTKADLDRVLAKISSGLRGEGLKNLTAKEVGDTDRYEVFATASPPTKIREETVLSRVIQRAAQSRGPTKPTSPTSTVIKTETVEEKTEKDLIERAKKLVADKVRVLVHSRGGVGKGSPDVAVVDGLVKDEALNMTFVSPRKRGLAAFALNLREFFASYDTAGELVKPYSGGDHQSRFVIAAGKGYELDPKYREAWRRFFYPSGYGKELTNRKRQLLGTDYREGSTEGLRNPANHNQWYYEGHWYDHISRGPGEATYDHDPPVVQHWNTVGHNQTQAEREAWYQGGKWELVPRSLNSSWGSEVEGQGKIKMNPTVGPNFRGRGEQ